MRRNIRFFVCCLVLLFSLSACGSSAPQMDMAASGGQQALADGGVREGAEIAVLSTTSQDMSDLGQTIWSTVTRFAGEEGISFGRYSIDPDDENTALATFEQAAKGDARLIILMGDQMIPLMERAQADYPDIEFLLIGSEELPVLRENTIVMQHDLAQVSWMVGYISVMDGMRSLGYIETADDTAAGMAWSFVLGAEAAAGSLALDEQISVYPLSLEDENTIRQRRQKLTQLYELDVEMVFANDSDTADEVLRAAKNTGSGVAGWQIPLSTPISYKAISFEKAFGEPFYTLLTEWQKGSLHGMYIWSCGFGQQAFTVELQGFRYSSESVLKSLMSPETAVNGEAGSDNAEGFEQNEDSRIVTSLSEYPSATSSSLLRWVVFCEPSEPEPEQPLFPAWGTPSSSEPESASGADTSDDPTSGENEVDESSSSIDESDDDSGNGTLDGGQDPVPDGAEAESSSEPE